MDGLIPGLHCFGRIRHSVPMHVRNAADQVNSTAWNVKETLAEKVMDHVNVTHTDRSKLLLLPGTLSQAMLCVYRYRHMH